MNVLMINGSPNADGCTYTALSEVALALREEGIDSELFQLGREPISGCIDCGGCDRTDNRCVLPGDSVNNLVARMQSADGLIIGSPVYYASANGSLIALLDRAFYCSDKSMFAHKPGAAIVSARRAGTTATLDELHKYFVINGMPIVPSQYWCMVHGNTPDEVRKDLEGMQIMRTLGHNMAWLLKCINEGKRAGITPNAPEKRVATNFIR